MPRSAPASSGLRRASASIPAVAQATASASKLVKTCTATSGDSATSAASHGRFGRRARTAHTTTSHASASHAALMSKYTTTGSAVGSTGSRSAAHTHASASRALAYWKYPVSTGYSM
jgi:hypothetical protein